MSSGPIRMCSVCGQSYWSMEATALIGEVCPSCMGAAMPLGTAKSPEEPQDAEPGPPRFVSLSALPPEKRLRPRQDGTRPGLMVPRRLAEQSAAAGPAMAEVQPPPPPVTVSPPAVPVSRESPSPVNCRQLGFNCPSCFTVLVIKNPESYDGRAAPCPCCSVVIMPPRIAPPSPFTLVDIPTNDAPTLPPARPSRWKTFGQGRNEDSAAQADAQVA